MNNLYTLSKPAIEYLCNCINQLANVSEGIDDLNLRSDSTFSSVKIDTLLNTLKTDCNDYTDKLVTNLSRLELKIANAESEITQPNIMYLYKPSGASSYEQYVVIEGNKVLLGTCDIDMDNYFTIAQSNARYTLITDFNSLKTKVDGKVDKTDIIDNLTSTNTDKPLSANQGKVLKDEVDLKANDSEVLKKTDIVTTIDGTSTNDTVPTNKAVYDSLINKVDYPVYLNSAEEVNSFNKSYKSFVVGSSVADAVGLPNSPSSTWFCIHLSHGKGYIYPSQIAFEYAGLKRIMYRIAAKGVWSTWRKIPTTVADIGVTYINTFENETYVKPTGAKSCSYYVTNGHCMVTLQTFCLSTTNIFTQIVSGLPKPKALLYSNAIDRQMNSNSGARGVFQLTTGGVLNVVCNYGDTSVTGGRNLYVTFSYPVAE